MKWKAGWATSLVFFGWMLWANVQEAAKSPVWETKGSFETAAQCRNAVEKELERIKENEESKIEITKWYEFGASLTYRSGKESKVLQSYYCLPEGFKFQP